MVIKFQEVTIKTENNFQIIDITAEVEKFVRDTNITCGSITITTKHTTTAIRINENEELLFKDIKDYIGSLVPVETNHNHDMIEKRKNCSSDEPKNAHSHLKALMLGASETLPIFKGKLYLGTWQHILFIELDGPRDRTYTMVLIGE